LILENKNLEKIKMKKYTIEDCKKIAQERGGECLSTEYIDIFTKYSWKCENDHKWEFNS
jgi:hypothetical protein